LLLLRFAPAHQPGYDEFFAVRNPAQPPLLVLTLLCALATGGCTLIATQAQPEKPPAVPVEFIESWGVKGDHPGELDAPVSISTDSIGNIYLADAGSRFVHKFSPRGNPLLSFQEDALKHPEWITLDRGGAIYVGDPVRSSVFVFWADAEHRRELHLRTRPTKENMLSVAVGWDGLIYVLDSNASKVFTYTPRFRLVQSWQMPNSYGTSDRRTPPGPVEMGLDGSLYVASGKGPILRFTREGHVLSQFGETVSAASSDPRFSGEFAVSSNYLFVMDADGRMLHVLTLDGAPKLDVDLAPELGQAPRPAPAIAVSPRNELLVLDTPGTRVLRYHINF
jgi:tripartite motif-containing protein 71